MQVNIKKKQDYNFWGELWGNAGVNYVRLCKDNHTNLACLMYCTLAM